MPTGVYLHKKGRLATYGSFKIGHKISDETRKRISFALKGKKYITKLNRARVMYGADSKWLSQFKEKDKIKFLNNSIVRKRDKSGFNVYIYKSFIEKFYWDVDFNYLYYLWKTTGDKWIKPSLDHIVPKSKGGAINDIDNLRFVSWFENHAKTNIDNDLWERMKSNLNYYLTPA